MGAPETEKDSSDSERPQHKVTISTFFMGRYSVTQEQWRTIMGNNPSKFKGDKRPVERVSWDDAKRFCDKVSQKTEGKRTYRLPTEAEWEYACRAISIDLSNKDLMVEEWNERYYQPFCFGETLSTELANHNGNNVYGKGIKGEYRDETTEVGIFPPNQFGLWDMHGNVWEWCEDDYHDNYQNSPSDGSSWTDGQSSFKVIRGGSWISYPNGCRSASRVNFNAENADFIIGFRVVCEVSSVIT